MYRTRFAFLFMLAIVSLACGVAAPSPGRAQMAVDGDPGRLAVVGRPVQLAGVVFDSSPTYSPDGSKIAFQSRLRINTGDKYGDIYVMNADGASIINLTRSPRYNDESPSWSPDGFKIAFNSALRDDNIYYPSRIHVMNADGTNPINLSQYDARGRLAWSSDSSKIAFTCEDPTAPGLDAREEILEICVVNADGTNPVRLTHNSVSDSHPTWSPDGSKIAFASGHGRDSEDFGKDIYVMNADGTNPVRLTEMPRYAFATNPQWSPDGSKIAFITNRWYSDFGIAVMNADGTNPYPLWISYPGNYTWSPDGSQIADSTLCFSEGCSMVDSNPPTRIIVYNLRYRGSLRATLLNLSPGQAWVHLYCLKDRAGPDADPPDACAVTFECYDQSPLYTYTWRVKWQVEVGPKTIFSYWPNKTATDGTAADLEAALIARGKPEDEARTTCEVFSPDPLTVRGYTLFGGQPTLVPVAEPARPDVAAEPGERRRQATLPNLSPGQAWVHLYCLKDRDPDVAPCAVTFECNGQSGEPVTWPVEVGPKSIFSYWPNKTVGGLSANLQAALIAAGKPEDEARRRTTCEVSSADPIAVRGYTRFGGQPTLVPVTAYPLSR